MGTNITQQAADNVANALEELCETGFEDDEGNSYFEDHCYNTDYIYRMGRGVVGVRVMVACGGPNIWVDTTRNEVVAYWGGTEASAYITDRCCDAVLDIFTCCGAELDIEDDIHNL